MNPAVKIEKDIWQAWRRSFAEARIATYETRARKSFSRRGISVNGSELKQSIKQASVIVVGDDRLNPLHQQEALKFLRGLRQNTSKAILTDRFPVDEQSGINRYLQGKMGLADLLRRLEIDADRSTSPEGGVALWLKWMQRHGVKLILTPSSGRTLVRRDAQLAIEAKRLKEKFKTVILWTGTLRLAPSHVPSELAKRKVAFTSLLLGAAETRWGSGCTKGWVKTHPNAYAYVGDSPLLSLEYRRAWENRVLSLVGSSDLEAFFLSSIDKVAQKLGKKLKPGKPKFFHPFEIDSLNDLGIKKMSSRTGKFLFDRVLKHESAVIPQSQEVLLSTLEKGHIAEEAAHFLRLRLEKTDDFGPVRTSLEEAFGFLAGRWVDPARTVPSPETPFMSSWEAVHQAGYELGAHLHGVWQTSKKGRDKIRRAWNQRLPSEEDAYRLWTHLSEIQ